ncbi:MAG: PEP-utilizing enzyme [Patescibacteria group bacterium]|nr:PEP-utilizing enzyme [Patescibacteria group bacterium]
MSQYTFKKSFARIKNKTAFYKKSAPGYLFGMALQGLAVAHGEKASPYAMQYGFHFQNHNRANYIDWFWDRNLLLQKRKDILNAIKKDNKFSAKFYKLWNKSLADYLSAWNELAQVDFNKLSVKEIRKRTANLYRKIIDNAVYGYVVDAFLDDSEEDWFEKIIKDELGKKATSEVIAKLTAPVFNSFVNEFELGKLKIAQKIIAGKNKKLILVDCKKLAAKFFWARSSYFLYQRVSVADIYREVREELKKLGNKINQKIKEENERYIHNRQVKRILFNKLKISPFLRGLIETSEFFTDIQDKRKGGVLRSDTIFYEALQAVAKKEKLDRSLIFCITPMEFLSEEKFKKIDWLEIKQRRDKGVLAIYCNEDIHLIPRSRYDKDLPINYYFQEFHNLKEVRGAAAYRGVVRGIARVIFSFSEVKNFKAGEILVVNQTTPEYVPLMKKAAAFVTDQGGITCHAAIIAREMKKPCIIGTKIATKVLRDGDLVEVDANQGIVKIITK